MPAKKPFTVVWSPNMDDVRIDHVMVAPSPRIGLFERRCIIAGYEIRDEGCDWEDSPVRQYNACNWALYAIYPGHLTSL